MSFQTEACCPYCGAGESLSVVKGVSREEWIRGTFNIEPKADISDRPITFKCRECGKEFTTTLKEYCEVK